MQLSMLVDFVARASFIASFMLYSSLWSNTAFGTETSNVLNTLAEGAVSPAELSALFELYNATNGIDWQWKLPLLYGPEWNFSSEPATPTPCRDGFIWQGLNCTCPVSTLSDDVHNNTYCVITSLILTDYGLDGYLPHSIGNLTQLITLDLGTNALTGSIPSLDSLSQLVELDLSSNAFRSSIPSLDSLKQLQGLYLERNALTGSIPSLSSLKQLLHLYIDTNYLTGSIPSLNYLSLLQRLSLYNNLISGSIPSLDSLSQLQLLYLNNNDISGSISSLESTSHLVFIDLSDNSLTGSIPLLNGLNQLIYFELNNNFLSGSIPALNSLSLIKVIFLSDNALTGSIPSLDSISQLLFLDLSDNALTGSIPSLDSLSKLLYFEVNSNVLTSSIPSLAGPSRLLVLVLYNNALTGSIPSLANLSQLRWLYLHDNILSGPIPSLKNSSGLRSLQLQNNRLTGKLEGVFSRQYHLTTIQLSENQLSGTIPGEIFELESLQTFAIVSNCMRGPLPIEAMCNSSSLKLLLLDGLHTASSCRTLVFGLVGRKVYILDSDSANLADQLHPCLLSIPTLNTLHMSGNGLTGTVPRVPQQSNITNLALSHNFLKGPVPLSVQKQITWINLDLSYNRIAGELTNEFTDSFEANDGSSISLSLNRISGQIPQSLMRVANISILTGNMFSCDYKGNNLPVHDDERWDYSCGSNALNIPFYTWLAVIGIILVLLLIVEMVHARGVANRLHNNSSSCRSSENCVGVDYITTTGSKSTLYTCRWLNASTSLEGALRQSDPSARWTNIDKLQVTSVTFERPPDCKHIRQLEQLLSGIRQVAGSCWMYTIFVLTPLCIICGQLSGTYTYRYLWTISTSFLSGPRVTELLFSALTVYVCILSLQYRMLVLSLPAQVSAPVAAEEAATAPAADNGSSVLFPSTGQRVLYAIPWIVIVLINILVVGSANVGFVWVSIYHGSRLNLFAVQVGLATVKVAWNSKLLRLLIHWFAYLIHDPSVTVNSVLERRAVALELCLSVFNNVIVPCLVVAVVDPECYYNFLVPPERVTASYEYLAYECGLSNCRPALAESATSFDPPFMYSYQCSASFTTHYATAFLYLCIVIGIVIPLWELFLMYLYSTQLDNYIPFLASVPVAAAQCPVLDSDIIIINREEDDISPLAAAAATTTTTEVDIKTEGKTITGSANNGSSHAAKAITGRGTRLLHWLLSSTIVPRLLKPVPLSSSVSKLKTRSHSDSNNNNNNKNNSSNKDNDSDHKPPIFNSTQHLTTVVIMFALILTFGTVFPPLGLVIFVTLVVYTYFAQFKLARFISMSTHAGLTKQLEQLDKECTTFVLPSKQGFAVLATIVCWFYAFILFDTLGDTASLDSALCVLFAMALLIPLVICICDQFLPVMLQQYDTRHDMKVSEQQQEKVGRQPKSGVKDSSKDSRALEMGRMTLKAQE